MPGFPSAGVSATTRAGLLTAAGALLLFAAPRHRLDLLALGFGASLAGLVWRPMAGPFVVAASWPLFFFSRTLLGPLAFSPPGLLLVLAWAAALVQALRGRLRVRVPSTGYDAPLALFLAAALLSLGLSQYLVLSARDLRALVVEPVAFFWLLAALGARRAVPAAVAGFLLAATLAALAAIAQVALGLGGTEAEGVRRAQGWYPSPNHLALMLGRAVPFALALGCAMPGRAPRLGRLAGRAAAAVTSLALLLTFSTGGWLGAAAATLVVLAARGWRRASLVLGGGGAAVLLAVFGLAAAGRLPERLNPLRQTGGFRLDLWQSSIDMLRDHPFGVGLDNFAYLYQQVYLREGAAAEPNLSHPHNWVLNLWLSLGPLGLAAFVWLAGRAARRASRRPGDWLAAGALGALADLLVHGLIDNSYFLVDLAFLFWLTLAAAREPDAAPAGTPDGRRARIPPT